MPDSGMAANLDEENPLLFEPTDDQQALLHRVWAGAVQTGGTWPVWDYVERHLQPVVAGDVLGTFPVIAIKGSSTGRSYGPLDWRSRAGALAPQADSRMVLTVAGLRHIRDQAAAEVMDTAIAVVGEAESQQRRTIPDPLAPVGGRLTRAQSVGFARSGLPMLVLDVLRSEPAIGGFLGGPNGTATADDWSIELGPHLRHYQAVTSPEDYLARVLLHSGWTPLSRREDGPPLPAPLLPELLSHLDLTWKVAYETRLFRRALLDPGARIGKDCDDREGFNDRLSALGEILNAIRLPDSADPPAGADGKPLGPVNAMERFLLDQLPTERHPEIAEAVTVLRTALRIRAVAQHGLTSEASRSYQFFGLPVPPTDWGAAWATVRTEVAQALRAIRHAVGAGD